MEKLQITKTYLEEIIKEPLTTKEIHSKLLYDFNIDDKFWKLKDTINLFKIANISLRSKPRRKKIQIEIV